MSRLLALRDNDRPGYRVSNAPRSCTSLELLSVLIGGAYQMEAAEALLSRFNGDLGRLYNASVEDMTKVQGVGKQVALRIKAAVSLSIMLGMNNSRQQIVAPSDAATLVHAEMSLFEKEHFRVILLDRRNFVMSIEEVYIGAVGTIPIRLSEVFAPAIRRNASAIILVHNHPSGNPEPSPDDGATTRAAVQAGKLLGISVLDHIIIGRPGWKSLKDTGIGFT